MGTPEWDVEKMRMRGQAREKAQPLITKSLGQAPEVMGECTSAEGWAPTKESSQRASGGSQGLSRTLKRGDGELSGNPNARQ